MVMVAIMNILTEYFEFKTRNFFKTFSFIHIISLTIIVIVILLLLFFIKDKNEKKKKIFRLTLAIIALVSYLSYVLWLI